jgi:hypothetical protein
VRSKNLVLEMPGLAWKRRNEKWHVTIDPFMTPLWKLRAESAVTVKWIAARLQMGTPGHVNHLLYEKRRSGREQYDNIKN